MSDQQRLVDGIERSLSRLLDATGASRGTLRADDAGRGWHSSVPCAEVLRHGAPTMRYDGSLNHRAAATIQWIAQTRSILMQPDLRDVTPDPPRALMETYLAKAQMVGPLLHAGELYGWVSAHDVRGPRPWSPADAAAMTAAIEEIRTQLFGVP